MSRSGIAAVPSFFLYGEPPRDAGDRFLHLESLSDRSRPANWRIRPHAHADLDHVFSIVRGCGVMTTETGEFGVDAPAVLIVPARTIHAFQWRPETVGQVLTLSRPFLESWLVRDDNLRRLFDGPRHVHTPSGSRAAGDVERGFEKLALELAWTAPSHSLAVDSLIGSLLVDVARLDGAVHGAAAPAARDLLLARFRQAVQANYLSERSTAFYARSLGVSEARLRAACRACATRSPLNIIQDRVLLEAKRLLLYTHLTVAEIAYQLGYDDAAYFSRLFRRGVGMAPGAYRSARRSP